MDLEQSVKRSQMALVVIERALNDPTGWTIGVEGRRVDAQVIVTEDGATFWARFPETPTNATSIAVLSHQGEVLWVAKVTEAPERGGFEVEITLLASTETVST